MNKDGILRKISSSDKLNECLEVIHITYKKRDEDLGLKTNNHTHSSLSYDDFKKMYDNGIQMYGYYLEEKLVAFLSLDIKEEIKIKDIVVLPEYQNMGLGTSLLDFVKESTKDNHKKKIKLGMIYENEELRLWYEKNGFSITEVIKYPNSDYETAHMEYVI